MAEETAERGENAYDWQSLMFLYNAAIKEVRTKLDIMNDEFQYIHQYNPIEYIKSRIKTPNSIAKKLSRHGLENTILQVCVSCAPLHPISIVWQR